MVQRCLATKISVNLNSNMYVQEFGAESVFTWTGQLSLENKYFILIVFLSVTVYMKIKSWQHCGWDIRTHIVKLPQDKQHKCCLFFLKSVRKLQSEGAWPTFSDLFAHFAWWSLVITNSHHTRKGQAVPIRSDVLYPSLCKCINKTRCGQSALCSSMLRFLLGWSQRTLLCFAALLWHEQTFP